MARREEYGNTWWGNEWLQALSKIDYSNRIPRGKSYARRGMVSDLMIFDGQLKATVKGSRPKPYKVTLTMGKFDKQKVNNLLAEVMNYPTIISRLLSGTMDPLLLEVAEKMGLRLLPKSSQDMEMNCSCPDWAVPCKHIAAAIYKITSDIDNNPFILFKFRAIDLPRLLSDRNINIYEIQNQEVKQWIEFTTKHIIGKKNSSSSMVGDFTILQNRLDELPKLLPDETPFYTYGDFKKLYNSNLKQAAKVADRILSERAALSSYLNEKEVQTDFDEPVYTTIENHEFKIHGINLSQLWLCESAELDYYHPSFRYYSDLLRLSMHCIAKGLVFPQLFEEDGQFMVFWQPARLDPALDQLINSINTTYGLKSDQTTYDSYLTLSAIITHLLAEIWKSSIDQHLDSVASMFFNLRYQKFEGLSESAIPNSISRWLRLFTYDLGDFFPVITVNIDEELFLIKLQIANKNRPQEVPKEFSEFVNKTKDQSQLFDFYKDLDLLSKYIPKIAAYINSGGAKDIVYDASEFPKFLFEIQPIMELLNIKVVLPKSLKHLIRPKSSMSIKSNSGESSGLLGLSNLLDFDWKVSLGKDIVTPEEFYKLVSQAGKLIKYKSQYIFMDQADMLRLTKEISRSAGLTNIEVLKIALSEEFDGAPIHLTDEVKMILDNLTKFDLIPQPQGLKATFRAYQHRGYSWMVKNCKIGIGSIIADDMGLGKTLQVIALLTYLQEEQAFEKKKALIIVPTSLIPNWESEIIKFSPNLDYHIHYGNTRDIKLIENHEVILTTYGVLRSDVAALKKYKWILSVIDEAQNIKNPSSQQTKAVKALKSDHAVAMSGTPVENRLLDYWSVMDFVNKGLLGNKTKFSKEFDKPISKDRDQKALARFTKITSPFIIRRMKTDKSIISDLPDKIVLDTKTSLTVEQGALYKKVLEEALEVIKEADETGETSLFKRQGLVLQMILSLKQICNHPSQWLKDGRTNREASGKLSLLIDTLTTIFEAGEKVIIFTQFKTMGDIIEAAILENLRLRSLWLHGGVSMAKRKIMVNAFQEDAQHKVMILSLKAGGTGLNLTAANHVIHYDLWWNPAVEAQATDRAFRIGQKKNVFVHRFITQHTFEEKINDLIQSKKELADLTVSSGEKWIGDLSNRELENMFKIDGK